MNATLSQKLAWDPIPGLNFQVKARRDGETTFLFQDRDVGAVNEIALGELLDGVDFSAGTAFRFAVRSIFPDGTLPDAYTSEIVVTIVGGGVPQNLRVV